MSPIGRVFAVLNVGFAFAFLYHAGVYLQRDAYWKNEYTALESSTGTEIESLKSQLGDAANERDAAVRTRDRVESEAASLRDDKTGLEDRVRRLQQDRDELRTTFDALQSNYNSINSTLENNSSNAEKWLRAANEAEVAKDAAERSQTSAENDLREARNEITALQTTLTQRNNEIAQLTGDLEVERTKLAVIRMKAPGLNVDGTSVPAFGRVLRVDAEGRLLTIGILESDGEIKSGHQFAVYAGSTYKGEATVTSVNNNQAFCRMARMAEGQRVAVGDQATSKL